MCSSSLRGRPREITLRNGFIATVRILAEMVGVPTTDALGRSTIGEHVWRVSGARHLAALDVLAPIILRLARWDTAIVLRYIADAPLSALTRVYLEKSKAADAALRALSSKISTSITEITSFSVEI